jgi:hypothetical protein
VDRLIRSRRCNVLPRFGAQSSAMHFDDARRRNDTRRHELLCCGAIARARSFAVVVTCSARAVQHDFSGDDMIWVKQAPRIKYLNSSAVKYFFNSSAWRVCCGAGRGHFAELQAHSACHIHPPPIVCAERQYVTREITDLLLQRQTFDCLHARGHDDGGHTQGMRATFRREAGCS